MADLFGPVTRDERQAQCIENWVKHKGKATVVGATGFGSKIKFLFEILKLVKLVIYLLYY